MASDARCVYTFSSHNLDDRVTAVSSDDVLVAAGSAQYPPNGKLVVSGSPDGTVVIWDFDSVRPPRKLQDPQGYGVTSVAFSLGGDLLASGTEEDPVRIWEVDGSDDPRHTPTEYNKQRVISVVFGPNDIVASCSNDQMIYTRKPDGSDLQSYQDTTPVFSVAFPPAGILASCGGDWLVKIWNPPSDDAPLLLQGHGSSDMLNIADFVEIHVSESLAPDRLGQISIGKFS